MSKHIDAELGLAYLEGRLDPARRAKLERHLAECDACQAQLRQHQATHSLLHKTAQEFQAVPVHTPAWSVVRQRQQQTARAQTRMRTSLQLAAAAAAFILFIAFLLSYPANEPTLEPAASSEPNVTATAASLTTPVTTPVATPLAAQPDPSGAAATPLAQTSPVTTTLITPVVVVTPGPVVSQAFVSSQGRIALVREGVLYVQADDGSFAAAAEIALPAAGDDGPVDNDAAAWSPDGSALTFFYYPASSASYELGIWQNGTVTPLSQLVNQPLPIVPFTSFRWSLDGEQIMLTTSSRFESGSEWTSGVWLVTPTQRELTLVVEARELSNITWLAEERFMLTLACGRDCALIMAYNEQTELLWKAYEEEEHATSGLFTLTADRQHLINLNTVAQTVDWLDTAIGDIIPLWHVPAGQQFAPVRPLLSPDGEQVVFTVLVDSTPVLMRLGLDGEIKGQRENSTALAWRPGGGLVVSEALDASQNQLLYWGVDGAIDRLFVRPKHFHFDHGQWSADGRYFVYSAVDESIGASYLYLWQPESGVPELIQATASSAPFSQFVWLPDGTGFTFNLEQIALWFYDVTTRQTLDLNSATLLGVPDS